MLEKLRLYYQKQGCEICVATIEATVDGKTVIRTMNFSGNAISGVLSGAVRVVNELQELLGQSPEGYVERPVPKKRDVREKVELNALDQAQLLLRGLRHENTVQKETIIQYAAQLAEANAKIQSLEAALKGEGDHER